MQMLDLCADYNAHYFAHHSVMVAMTDDMKFKIINGANWAVGPVFAINQYYHIRVQANMADHNYEVFITPEGGVEA